MTPPFAGFPSGHSAYSRAAALLLDEFTGSPFFPNGHGRVPRAAENEFLVFEDGPSVDVTLQYASYYDASDQTSLSRIWGGIHPPQDDIVSRHIGAEIATDALAHALGLFGPLAPAACSDGVDDDGDGLVDWDGGGVGDPDPGCDDADDPFETSASLPCDNGLDDDGDTLVDTLDPACSSGVPPTPDPTAAAELTACHDGLDNDGLFGIDFDGGASLDLDEDGFIDTAFNPATPLVFLPDPQCVERPWRDKEASAKSPGCGLGGEAALIAAAVVGLRARRRRIRS